MVRKTLIAALWVASLATLFAWITSPWLYFNWGCSWLATPRHLSMGTQNQTFVVCYRIPASIVSGYSHRHDIAYWHGFMCSYCERLIHDEDDNPVSVESVYRVEFPLWVLLLVLLAYPLATFLPPRLQSRLHRWRHRKDGLCPQCGYSLTGNVTGICPECGSPTPSEAKISSQTQDEE